MEKSTTELLNALGKASASELSVLLQQQSEEFFAEDRPFATFMRKTLETHGVTQQELFLRTGLSQQYGYRLIAESKRTRQRDIILRLCIGGRFTLNETQRALRLYGFSPLYVRIPRDAVLLKAFQDPSPTVESVNALLRRHGMPELKEQEHQGLPTPSNI